MAQREFIIDGAAINQESSPYVIAEIGNNHQGDVEICRKLFKKAHLCGANAVKLQKKDNKSLYTAELYNSPYENENSFGRTYGEHKEALEFDWDEFSELKNYASSIGTTMFSTAFDIESVYFLEKLDVPAYKVASGCLTDFELLETIAGLHKPMIISTGGWAHGYVDKAYQFLKAHKAHFCFLHCIASYPNRIEEMNLCVIGAMLERYPDIIIGMSDHHSSVKTALFAYFQGARIIEKHFTLSRAWKGPDHAFSLEPKGLETLCEDLKDAKLSLGNKERDRLLSEEKPIRKMSKGIYAARCIKRGERIVQGDITVKIPGIGLEPYHVGEIVGKIASEDIPREAPIMAGMLDNYAT